MKSKVVIAALFLSLMAQGTVSAQAVSTLPLADIRSVTIYEGPADVWLNPSLFDTRVKEASALGFNTIWIVVPWYRLESDVGGNPAESIGGTNYSGTWLSANEAALRQSLSSIRNRGMRVIWSVNYLGAAWQPAGLDYKLLNQAPNNLFFYRYADKVAEILSSEGMADESIVMVHDEGILSPDANLWQYTGVQQSYRNYLFAKDPSLSFWNQRWGTAHTSWATVLTTNSPLSQGLNTQDTLDFICWKIKQSIGGGHFVSAVTSGAGGSAMRVAYHFTYNKFRDHRVGGLAGRESPLASASGFDFLSTSVYDRHVADMAWTRDAGEEVDELAVAFPSLPIFVGELGSSLKDNPVPALAESRQAEYIARALDSLGGAWSRLQRVVPAQFREPTDERARAVRMLANQQ